MFELDGIRYTTCSIVFLVIIVGMLQRDFLNDDLDWVVYANSEGRI